MSQKKHKTLLLEHHSKSTKSKTAKKSSRSRDKTRVMSAKQRKRSKKKMRRHPSGPTKTAPSGQRFVKVGNITAKPGRYELMWTSQAAKKKYSGKK